MDPVEVVRLVYHLLLEIGGRESAATEMLSRRTMVPSKGGGGGGDGGGGQYPSLLFLSNYCGQSFCLAYVELFIVGIVFA